ncbi:MAG: type II toxin-antitoxin system VapC family toxin [Sphingomonadales bacterium]|nr:MAG: type II toxin-antitoxin system VapC family toxin [Sphingomonadales bacterium]
MFLLDTEIVLGFRNVKLHESSAGLASWATMTPRHSLFLSAMALLELEHAAARAERRQKGASAAWQGWIHQQLLPAFEGRILPVDAAIAVRAARLGYAEIRDGLLAATAAEHNLTLATRRTNAFKAGRIKLLDPWNFDPDAEGELDADWREASRAGSHWLKNLFVRA